MLIETLNCLDQLLWSCLRVPEDHLVAAVSQQFHDPVERNASVSQPSRKGVPETVHVDVGNTSIFGSGL